jgi:hypothetical protein
LVFVCRLLAYVALLLTPHLWEHYASRDFLLDCAGDAADKIPNPVARLIVKCIISILQQPSGGTQTNVLASSL